MESRGIKKILLEGGPWASLATMAAKHLIAVLKVGSAWALKGALGEMNGTSVLVTVKLLRKANAADVTTKLAHLGMYRALVLEQVVLALKLERTQVTRKAAGVHMDRAQMLEEV